MTSLRPGDPAPLFVGTTTDREEWWLSTAVGAHTVLTFAGGRITVAGRTILDDTGEIAASYGITHGTVVLDPRLRVLAVLGDPADADR